MKKVGRITVLRMVIASWSGITGCGNTTADTDSNTLSCESEGHCPEQDAHYPCADGSCPGEEPAEQGCERSLYYVDRDSDGYGNADQSQMLCSDASTAPPGFTTDSSGDCDDADPTVHSWRGLDEDEDGYPLWISCTKDESWLPMAPDTPYDCDDTDDSVYPTSTDLAGDGVDSDCDGIDGTHACDGIGDCMCMAAFYAEAERGLDPECLQADPFVAALEACPGCQYAGAVIVVGNRGNTPISPGLKITLNAGGKPQEPAFLPEAIEPGGLSVPFEFGRDFLANELTATIEYETDCDATNNSRSVILGSLGCR